MNTNSLQSKRLLRLPDVMALVGLKRTAVYDRVKRGVFPAPIDLGGRLVAWRSEDIEAWIDSLVKSGK